MLMLARVKPNLLLFVLAACGAQSSADPLDISPAVLRIDMPHPAPERLLPAFRLANEKPSFRVMKGDVEVYVSNPPPESRYIFFGPQGLRLDYGIPFQAQRFSPAESRGWSNLDAPGPGYREQMQRLLGP